MKKLMKNGKNFYLQFNNYFQMTIFKKFLKTIKSN